MQIEWKHGFISYPQGNALTGQKYEYVKSNIHKWSHIEYRFQKSGFQGLEAKTILYLIDENSVDIDNTKIFQEKVNKETNRDILNPLFLRDSNFYRQRLDGKWEYNQVRICFKILLVI